MKKHKYNGLFIAFEGLDGSGSSSQVEILKKRLAKEGYKAYTTKEPTDNIVGGLIRGVLTKQWKISHDGLQLLFAADRAHNLQSKIEPNLDKGHIIINDRYAFSSIAFGSMNVDFTWLENIYENYILPDITFLIKTSPKVCIERIASTRASMELFEEEKKLKKVWRGYEKLANDPKNKIVLIDGEQPIEKVSEAIWQKLEPILKKKTELIKS